jgi:hypothetical protein
MEVPALLPLMASAGQAPLAERVSPTRSRFANLQAPQTNTAKAAT